MPLLLALGAAAWYGHYWWTTGRYLVSDRRRLCRRQERDASAKVSGYVSDVAVDDNAHVTRGRRDRPHRRRRLPLAVQTARDKIAAQQATIERIGKQIAAQQAAVDQAKAQLASAKAGATRADLELKRQQELADAADRQPADARAGAGQPRSGRRRRAGGAGGDRGGRQPMSTC